MAIVDITDGTEVLINAIDGKWILQLIEMALAEVADDTEDILLLNIALVDIADVVEVCSLLNVGLTVIIDVGEVGT